MSSGDTLELAIELFGLSRTFAEPLMEYLADQLLFKQVRIEFLEVFRMRETDPDQSKNSRMIRGVLIGITVEEIETLVNDYLSFPEDDVYVCDLLQESVECRS